MLTLSYGCGATGSDCGICFTAVSNKLRGRDNETSKMNGVRRATQASLLHIHIHPRPYGCLANFFLKDHNRVPMDCCGKVEIHERKCPFLIVYIVMNLPLPRGEKDYAEDTRQSTGNHLYS